MISKAVLFHANKVQAEEIASLRQALSAAEKERDEAKKALAYRDEFFCAEHGRNACAECIDEYRKTEAKLSLYESAPSEPEVKMALSWASPLQHYIELAPHMLTEAGKHGLVLARALRACQAKLAEAQSRIPEQEISDARLMAEKHEDRALVANRRAEKAESELAAAQRVIATARKEYANWNRFSLDELGAALAALDLALKKGL